MLEIITTCVAYQLISVLLITRLTRILEASLLDDHICKWNLIYRTISKINETGNDMDSNKRENSSNDEYEDLSSIEEHELDYKKRLQRMEFTDGSSQEELLEKANSLRPSPSSSNRARWSQQTNRSQRGQVCNESRDGQLEAILQESRRSGCILHS
jgi:hypothetical protein